MAITLVFETHSITVDNEQGRATGWLPGQLSERGRALARELGRRHSGDQIVAVFTSDLARATETASAAFAGAPIPLLYDWRLANATTGSATGCLPPNCTQAVARTWTSPILGGESWQQAITRVGRFLRDLPLRWEGQRILIIGHVATRWGLDHYLNGVPLEDLIEQDFAWQEGWEYQLSQPAELTVRHTTSTRLSLRLPVIHLNRDCRGKGKIAVG